MLQGVRSPLSISMESPIRLLITNIQPILHCMQVIIMNLSVKFSLLTGEELFHAFIWDEIQNSGCKIVVTK